MGLVQPRNGNPDHVHYTTLTPRHPSPPQAISKCLFIKQQMIQGMRSKRFTDRLPSENQLAAAFGVSRMTARRALVELEAEGLVERIRGKGTYIKKPEPAMGYFVVQPSRRHAETLGVSYTSRVMELRSLEKPPHAVAKRLDYQGMTILARRLHCFDGKPVRYEIRHLRGDLCASILFEDLEAVSIHELLVEPARPAVDAGMAAHHRRNPRRRNRLHFQGACRPSGFSYLAHHLYPRYPRHVCGVLHPRRTGLRGHLRPWPHRAPPRPWLRSLTTEQRSIVDGFVRSPISALCFIPRHCGVR
jgi:DNA-binding GntR family transcriptional regulator